MEDQISRTIFGNFDVANVDNGQSENYKMMTPTVLKSIENGSLHFISLPTRESEFIDHSLLNPEYITAHIANGGFIIDLTENQEVSNDNNSTQYIADTLANELQFETHDEQDRRITATLLQYVKSNSRTNNEAHVIVNNKDNGNELQSVEVLKSDSINSHSFLENALTQSILSDGQIKMLETNDSETNASTVNQTHNNGLQLPQLAPIRKLSRQRKISINCHNGTIDASNLSIQNSKGNGNDDLEHNIYLRPVAKKVLPHKKRITKKLKAIDRIESQNIISPPVNKNQLLQVQENENISNTQNDLQEIVENLNHSSHFSCQLCGEPSKSQLEFFAHLKEHYEPIKISDKNGNIMKEKLNNKVNPIVNNQESYEVDLQFNEFESNVINLHRDFNEIDNQKPKTVAPQFFHQNEENHKIGSQFHSKLENLPTMDNRISSSHINQNVTTSNQSSTLISEKCLLNEIQNGQHENLQQSSASSPIILTTLNETSIPTPSIEMSSKELIQDEVEFSDPEDMLEGIRSVVDKVQDDTGDEMDMTVPSQISWYSNSALNGDINFKSPQPHISNDNEENFQIYFKNEISTKEEHADNEYDETIRSCSSDIKNNNSLENNIASSVDQQQIDITVFSNSDNISIKSEDTPVNACEDTLDYIPSVSSSNKTEHKVQKMRKRTKKVVKNDSPTSSRRGRGRPLKSEPSKSKNEESNYSDSNSDSSENASYNMGDTKKNRKKYSCNKCGKVFNSINALKYHDFSHTGERPHQCDICGKSFYALNALQAHLRVHSGEKPFNCDECGRAFRQWGDLTYHKISLHSNERNFQCEFCGKAFARKYSLVIHRRIHTQERNYKCEFCPKTFRASSYLQNHRRIHTGEKPYMCVICNKKFRVCGDLKRHQKIHFRENKFANHLDEIINSEVFPIELIKNNAEPINEELIISDKIEDGENIETYYYTTNTNLDNLMKTTTTNLPKNENVSIENTSLTTNETTSSTIPSKKKRVRKSNVKKK